MHTFEVFADYNQFYLLDAGVQPPYPEDVSALDIERRFREVPHLVAIYTAEPTDVLVSVGQPGSAPPVELEGWEHVVECSLQLPSGRLAIAGCTDYLPECPELPVAPGDHAVRVHGRGFAGGAREEYLVLLWPGAVAGPRVLKQYREAADIGSRGAAGGPAPP